MMINFKWMLLISALLIATCAGFFSISGIGQLFVGAPVAAMIMAGALELGKLVSVSFVYRFWGLLKPLMRLYFLFATIVLMGITSVGVYGYLSSAYAKAGVEIHTIQNKIALVGTQQSSLDRTIGTLSDRIGTLESSRTQREARATQLVGRRGLADQQKSIRQTDASILQLQGQLTATLHTRDSLEGIKTQLQNSISENSKIGTFWYIANTFGIPLDTLVRWFILSIVLVFDPLSVTLIVAYNLVRRTENDATQPEPIVEPPHLQVDLPEWVPVDKPDVQPSISSSPTTNIEPPPLQPGGVNVI